MEQYLQKCDPLSYKLILAPLISYIYIPHFSKVTNTRINPMNVLSLQEKLTSTNLKFNYITSFFLFGLYFFFFCLSVPKKTKTKIEKTHQKAHHQELLAYSFVAVLN
jgi:hypothetical protein